MPKTETPPERVIPIRFYADRELAQLLRKVAGAEQQQHPEYRVSLQTILRTAVIDYARRNYPKLVPKGYEEEVA